MNDLMICVDNVSKAYRLGAIGGTTLRDELQRLGAKILKKEDPTIRIGNERLNKKGQFMALKNVSFNAKPGEAIGIIGHNGAGKSTLLKLITRITAPSDGRICLNGRVASMLEVGTGFHQELTGRENIYINGAILGMTKNEIDKKLEEIIDFSEVRQFIDTPVKRYSSGMYVKLAFSVAAHLDSEIVIMDEVLAVGDVGFQNKCIQKMKEIASSGRTVLYVSHNMATIRSLCNRCIVLSKGEKVFDGDVEEAIACYISTNFNLEVKRDLSNAKRDYRTSEKAHMNYIEVLDKQRCVFSMGEKMRFKLKWEGYQDFRNMQMRIGVFSLNGYAVGISYSECFSGRIGNNEHIITLDISHLLPGRYTLELIMNEISIGGGFDKHDVIKEAIMFEMIASDNNPIYLLSNSSWGFYEFENAKVV